MISPLSVNKTLAYANFFKFPLSIKDLHFWLITNQTITFSQFQHEFKHKLINPKLRKTFFIHNNRTRLLRLKTSQTKLKIAVKATRFLQIIPSIKLIAVTGSVAITNAKQSDDIDLMIVTSRDSLWITRLLVIPLLTLFFKRRRPSQVRLMHKTQDSLCLNLWLDALALSIPKHKRNLYTAHEILQIKPLLDRDQTYKKLLLANSWAKTYLANAYTTLTQQPLDKTPQKNKKAHLYIFSKIKKTLNYLSFITQYLYMKSKMTSENVSIHSAYFHPKTLDKNIHNYLSKLTGR